MLATINHLQTHGIDPLLSLIRNNQIYVKPEAAMTLQRTLETLQNDATQLEHDVRVILKSFVASKKDATRDSSMTATATTTKQKPKAKASLLSSDYEERSWQQRYEQIQSAHSREFRQNKTLQRKVAQLKRQLEQSHEQAQKHRQSQQHIQAREKRSSASAAGTAHREQANEKRLLLKQEEALQQQLVKKLQNERDAERSENFFLRRQIIQLQNKSKSNSSGGNTFNHSHKTKHETSASTMALAKIPTKKHFMVQQRLQLLQDENQTLQRQANQASRTWRHEKKRLLASLDDAEHENGRLQKVMKSSVKIFKRALGETTATSTTRTTVPSTSHIDNNQAVAETTTNSKEDVRK